MPYVKRSEKGTIIELHKHKASEHSEYLAGDHAEIVQFLNTLSDASADENRAGGGNHDDSVEYALKKSDRELARVTEDLISLLIDKKVIIFTDLPQPVQSKLLERERLRSSLYDDKKENFLDDSDSSI